MLGGRDRGEYRDPDLGKEPFGPYARAFLESGAVGRSATMVVYTSIAKNHVFPRFEAVPLRAIDAPMLRSWIGELKARGVGDRSVQVARQFVLSNRA